MDSGKHRGRAPSDGPSAGDHPESHDQAAADHGDPHTTTLCCFNRDGTAAKRRVGADRSTQTRAPDDLACPVTFAPTPASVDAGGHFKFRVCDASFDSLVEYLESLSQLSALDTTNGRFTVTDTAEVTAGTSFKTFRNHLTTRFTADASDHSGEQGLAVFIGPGNGDAIARVIIEATPSGTGRLELAGTVQFTAGGDQNLRQMQPRSDTAVDVAKPQPGSPTTIALERDVQEWLAHTIELSDHSLVCDQDSSEAIAPNPYYLRPGQLTRDLGYDPSVVDEGDIAKCRTVAAVRFIRVHTWDRARRGSRNPPENGGKATLELTDLSPVLPFGSALNVSVRVHPDVLA